MMKAKFLKPGQVVKVHGNVMTFLSRERRPCYQPLNWFQCEAYRGLPGPTESGKVYMTDHHFAKNYQPS